MQVRTPLLCIPTDPAITTWMLQNALSLVVEEGTAKALQIDGVKVFGKTGTAQKLDPETGGYSHRKHVASFICGAPAENPQVLVIVSVDEPSTAGEHYGGTVAAPPATQILERALKHLKIPPTMEAKHRPLPRE